MAEKLKFISFTIVLLAIIGLACYWAVNTIQSGTEFSNTEKIKQLQQENKNLTKQVTDLTAQLNVSSQSQPSDSDSTPVVVQASIPTTNVVAPAPAPTTKPTPKPTKKTAYKNQSLINELQKLITKNVSMKLKTSATSVGTVQTFLNLYNKTSNKIDNDYGTSTEKAVATFQKGQGLTANGLANSKTFIKMINWLKKQG